MSDRLGPELPPSRRTLTMLAVQRRPSADLVWQVHAADLAVESLQVALRVSLAKFCQTYDPRQMTTMTISLPDALRSFVDKQVASGGYGTSSEYVRELIRKDQDRQQLRALLLEGANSAPTAPADGTYFDALRDRVKGHAGGTGGQNAGDCGAVHAPQRRAH